MLSFSFMNFLFQTFVHCSNVTQIFVRLPETWHLWNVNEKQKREIISNKCVAVILFKTSLLQQQIWGFPWIDGMGIGCRPNSNTVNEIQFRPIHENSRRNLEHLFDLSPFHIQTHNDTIRRNGMEMVKTGKQKKKYSPNGNKPIYLQLWFVCMFE